MTNFILSTTEPSKESIWLKPSSDGFCSMNVFTSKGWVSTGITSLKIGDNVDISPVDGNVIITDNVITIGTNTVDPWSSTLVGFNNSITANILGGSSIFGYKNYIKNGRLTTAVGEGNNVTGQKVATFGNCNTINSTDAASKNTTDSSNWNTTIGQWNKVSNGYCANIFGGYNTASDCGVSTVIGYKNTLSGKLSTVLGCWNTASVQGSFILGYRNTITAQESTALGLSNNISAPYSTALGRSNTTTAQQSTAMGTSNEVNGAGGSAIGYCNTANGVTSTAIGYWTVTTNKREVATGYYNLSEADITAFSVGNGYKSDDTLKRHNVLMTNQAGDLYIVEKTPTDDSSINYYEAPMKRLQTWLNEKSDKVTTTSSLDSSVTLKPNTNVDITVSGDLSLTLEEPTDTSIVNTYMATIITSDSIGTINLPSNVKWEKDIAFEANSIYIARIFYNAKGYFGVINSWKL